MNRILILLFALMWCCTACTNQKENTSQSTVIFEEVTATHSGLDFRNDLTVTDSMNYFTYGYFYMGGGVGVGDFNQDGQEDLFFTSNMKGNELYLNSGNLQFEKITSASGISGKDKWYTGVTISDVNQDGWDDIYISVAGKWADRKNELWINKGLNDKGIPTFSEEAESYGIADSSYSIQSVFFDYDNDGDLDLLVGNYEPTPFQAISKDYYQKIQNNTWEASDHLYQNNGDGTFSDVTEASGIQNFGLTIGVLASDFNQDGHTDLYLSNDFNTPDRFFINNGDGTFTNHLESAFQHTAFYGMGVDAADFNQDGQLDIFQLDMSPADNYRSKANMASMNIPGFWNNVHLGFHYQYMYNTLQTYQGTKDGIPFYGDQAKFSGMESTDWSWACLFGDYDNDGLKDLYVSNGTRKDINNKDFFKWLERVDISLKVRYKELNIHDLMDRMPSKKVDNYMFRNVDGTHFERVNHKWGIQRPDFSNGMAYADLDQDGDLELIINNIDTTACVFKNLSRENQKHNYITINLKGSAKNQEGLGARMWLYSNGHSQYYEHTRTRGFQSAMGRLIHFGLGDSKAIDSLVVQWPNGQKEKFLDLQLNSIQDIKFGRAELVQHNESSPEVYFRSLAETPFQWTHLENDFDDFKREILIPHKLSGLGPVIEFAETSSADEGYVFLGGANGQASTILHIQGSAINKQILPDTEQEAGTALFLDVDKDGDLDLLIGMGGSEKNLEDDYYTDQLYLNESNQFVPTTNILPDYASSTGVLKAVDFDLDGDLDVFVGGRQVPGQYPSPASSFLLENKSENGAVVFEFAADTYNDPLKDIGMITDAVWYDLDLDGKQDLILVGEWMSPTVLMNKAGALSDESDTYFDQQYVGWWNCLSMADLNNDGHTDLIAGNLGKNYKYKAKKGKTFDVYAADFDQNGKQDIVLGYFEGDIQYPVRGKQCSSEQIPLIKEKFMNYDAFANSDLNAIYGADALNNALQYQANQMASMIFFRQPKKGFKGVELPIEAQMSSINAIQVVDINEDGFEDLFVAGNLFQAEIETPRGDASFGQLFINNQDQSFNYIPNDRSGLYLPNETRTISKVNWLGETIYLVGSNNNPIQVLEITNEFKPEPIAEIID